MINELYVLKSTLDKNNIPIPQMHPWIKKVKGGDALLVDVTNKNGKIVVQGVEYCSADRVATFWNIVQSNHKTFPKVNLEPLWSGFKDRELVKRFVEARNKKKWDQWLELANDIIESNPSSIYPDNKCKDKWNRLYKFPYEEILPALGNMNSQLTNLISCFSVWKEYSPDLIRDLFVQIIHNLLKDLSTGRLDCFKLAQDLIIKDPIASKQPQTTVIFNLFNKDGNIIVADKEEKQALSDALYASSLEGEKRYRCPLSGKMTSGPIDDKFPNPNLPVIGEAYLMAMNKKAECHRRYGKIGHEIFPASKEVAYELDNTVRFITQREREQKTWMRVISGKKKGDQDLLIAFAEDLPDFDKINPGLALMIGGDSSQERSFDTVSSMVIDAFKHYKIHKTSAKLRFFILRKISPGESQVILNDFCLFSQLIDAVETWKKASSNHPPFSLFWGRGKRQKPIEKRPPVPYPADLTKLLQSQWIRDGKESHELTSWPLIMSFDLFLERGARTESAARLGLQLLLNRLSPLLIGIAGAKRSGELDKYSDFARDSALMAVSFLGILLFKLGIKKEVYMKEVGYNIGRLFSLVDCLHKEYCKNIRDGEIPNQLLGNATFRTALDSPVKGLSRLSERMPVYKAWIDRQSGEKFRLAFWANNEMGKVAKQLSEMDIPETADDTLKAQMLLGYLAHTESKEK